jgi:hypothetical protein
MHIDARTFTSTILERNRKEQCARCGRMLGRKGKGYYYSTPRLRFELCPPCHRVLQRRSLKEFRHRIEMELRVR